MVMTFRATLSHEIGFYFFIAAQNFSTHKRECQEKIKGKKYLIKDLTKLNLISL
jgi:hypothetical protein